MITSDDLTDSLMGSSVHARRELFSHQQKKGQ